MNSTYNRYIKHVGTLFLVKAKHIVYHTKLHVPPRKLALVMPTKLLKKFGKYIYEYDVIDINGAEPTYEGDYRKYIECVDALRYKEDILDVKGVNIENFRDAHLTLLASPPIM